VCQSRPICSSWWPWGLGCSSIALPLAVPIARLVLTGRRSLRGIPVQRPGGLSLCSVAALWRPWRPSSIPLALVRAKADAGTGLRAVSPITGGGSRWRQHFRRKSARSLARSGLGVAAIRGAGATVWSMHRQPREIAACSRGSAPLAVVVGEHLPKILARFRHSAHNEPLKSNSV